MKLFGNRDLMVIQREARLAPELMQAETDWLNHLLNQVESPRNVAACSEVINLQRYRIERKQAKVLQTILEKQHRPFIFIFNKN